MQIRRELPLSGGLVVCVLAIAALAMALADNPSVGLASMEQERKLNTDFLPVGETPVIEINAGEPQTTQEKATACNGMWMGALALTFNSWFLGTEYYATYQDPIETGCPALITYPFEVQNVIWEVNNLTGAPLPINLQPVIYTANVLSPFCAEPGEVCCYGPVYNLNIPNGLVQITMPITCCVYGPYFAGVWAPDFFGSPIVLGILTDNAGAGGTFGASRPCGNYNNYRGFWEDLVVDYGFTGNLRLWSDGEASDVNTCDPCVYTIEPGVDLWTTPAGTSFDNHFTAMPLPAGFFDPGSEPFDGSVCLLGSPLPTNPPGALGSTDAVVRRLGPVPLLSVPDAGLVPIEIVALNLVSCSPITVTYPGPSQQWNVQVTLSSNMPQQQGQMTIRKNCCNGGTFDSQLPVLPKFIFTEVGNPSNMRVLDLGGMMPPIMFQSTGSNWSYDVPAPFDLVTCPGLVFCDHDLFPGTPDIIIPPSSKFTPGMRTLPCNPPTPNDPYCVGKSLTLEQEQLAQHGVLPPQETTPQEGACCLPDGSCIVTTPACCQIQGGTYLGDFVPCPLDCAPDTIYDSLCSRAAITVTLSPGDPNCSNPEPPIALTQMPSDRMVVRRSPGPPYIPGQIIDVELIQLNLQGSTPTLGPVIFRESPSRPSMGSVQVINTDAAGNLTLGDSFFDVFFEVDLPMIGRSMFNPNPTRMQATIDALPPDPVTTFVRVIAPPDLLLDNPGGFPVGFLCNATHDIISCGCCVGLRGSPNGDAVEANILDLNYTVNRIFRGGPPAACFEEGNPNGDLASLNVLDLNYFVNRIFRGGPLPVPCPAR